MRYIEPLLGVLAFLWFFLGSLLARNRLRDWRHTSQVLLGLSGMSLFGLMLYEAAHTAELRHVRIIVWAKAFLAGISIGIFVTLWLEGSLNLFKTARGRNRHPVKSDSSRP